MSRNQYIMTGIGKLSFSIRSLLIITAVVSMHLGLPFLGRAVLATIAAAIILNFIMVLPLVATLGIWHFARGGKANEHIGFFEWVAAPYILLLLMVYISFAIGGLIYSS